MRQLGLLTTDMQKIKQSEMWGRDGLGVGVILL